MAAPLMYVEAVWVEPTNQGVIFKHLDCFARVLFFLARAPLPITRRKEARLSDRFLTLPGLYGHLIEVLLCSTVWGNISHTDTYVRHPYQVKRCVI